MGKQTEKMTWKKEFSWDRGKAVMTSGDMILLWEASDPWRLWIGGEEITDFPYIHAEDWGLAKRYAEKTYLKFLRT